MSMTTRELALFGQLYLQGGKWNGRQLLSESWVTLATTRQTWSGPIGVTGEDGSDWHQGYGFQFWRCRHGFYRADGANGQLTIVMPQHDAVMSVHAGLGDMQKELNLIWEHIVPMLERKETPGEAAKARCAALAIPALSGGRDGAARFCGRTHALKDGARRGVKSVRLEAAEDGWTCAFETRAGLQSVPVGFGEWKRGGMRLTDRRHQPLSEIVGSLTTAASGAVQADGTLAVRILLLDGPQRIDLKFREEGGVTTASGNCSGIGGFKL